MLSLRGAGGEGRNFINKKLTVSGLNTTFDGDHDSKATFIERFPSSEKKCTLEERKGGEGRSGKGGERTERRGGDYPGLGEAALNLRRIMR